MKNQFKKENVSCRKYFTPRDVISNLSADETLIAGFDDEDIQEGLIYCYVTPLHIALIRITSKIYRKGWTYFEAETLHYAGKLRMNNKLIFGENRKAGISSFLLFDAGEYYQLILKWLLREENPALEKYKKIHCETLPSLKEAIPDDAPHWAGYFSLLAFCHGTETKVEWPFVFKNNPRCFERPLNKELTEKISATHSLRGPFIAEQKLKLSSLNYYNSRLQFLVMFANDVKKEDWREFEMELLSLGNSGYKIEKAEGILPCNFNPKLSLRDYFLEMIKEKKNEIIRQQQYEKATSLRSLEKRLMEIDGERSVAFETGFFVLDQGIIRYCKPESIFLEALLTINLSDVLKF